MAIPKTTSYPLIMGILNVTPDSFSDGGDYFSHDTAIARAKKMIEEGADIIDIGGESSRPGATPVSVEEELRRVLPVIKAICSLPSPSRLFPKSSLPLWEGVRGRGNNIPISIDTVKSQVAVKACEAGATMINDISAGTFDKEMFAVAARFNVPICLMHMKGTPKTMQAGDIHYDDLMGEISAYLNERANEAVKAGVARKNILIDPGIGFGKTVEHNIIILKQLKRLKPLKLPLVIGTSRKSFIGKLLGIEDPKERLEGSLATLAIAYKNGVDIFRVHDVAETKKFMRVLSFLVP